MRSLREATVRGWRRPDDTADLEGGIAPTTRSRSASTPQGILENIADLTPVPPPGAPAPPPALAEDAPPGGATAPITPIEKVKAAVKVVAKRVHPPPPLVTG